MATKPKAILSTHDGREASPITKASNVLFENGQTAQDILNDRQDAMISPVIGNSSSMFKVGQGDDVDYSANVVNGAYESMVLKGKSMVNCIQEPSSKDVVLPYEFEEGRYVTINDTKESGALGVELKGQTLVNLFRIKNEIANGGSICGYKDGKLQFVFGDTWDYSYTSGISRLKDCLPVTKGKKYYYRLELSRTPLVSVTVNSHNTDTHERISRYAYYSTTSSNQTIFTGTFEADENDRVGVHITDEKNGETITGTFVVLEYQQGMENWDIPFFEGMTSCKMPTLHTVGKNLCDTSKYIHGGISTDKGMIFSKDQFRSYYMKCKPSTTYVISVENSNNRFGVASSHTFSEDTPFPLNTSWFTSSSDVTGQTLQYTVTTTEKDKYLYVYVANNGVFNPNIRVQVEEATSPTSYESYKSSILSLPEEVELHKVGDIEDTLNCNTGEYVQRIREVVFNGSEYWTYSGDHVSNEEYVVYHAKITDPINSSNMGIANKLTYDKEAISTTTFTKECVYINSTYQVCYVRIKRERNGIIDYLTSNPLTVQYQLATPIVTKINLSSTLKSWNTTTHIYSEIPENTLYPILSHSNPSYPVILKPSTKYSIVANSYSNNHTNSAINFNLGGATTSTTVGNRVTTITTPSTLSNELLTMSGRGNKLNNVMVIEGDVVGDEPYFEGICDCKSPILSNVGKNLFSCSLMMGLWDKTQKKPILNDNYFCTTNLIRVHPNTRVKVSGTAFNPNASGNVIFYGKDKNYLGDDMQVWVLNKAKIPSNAYYMAFHFGVSNLYDIEGTVQIEVVDDVSSPTTAYEPYKSNILSANGDKIELTEDMFEQGTTAQYTANIGKTYQWMKENSTSSWNARRLRLKELIKIQPNTKLILQNTDNFMYAIAGYDANKLSLGTFDTGWVQNTTITIPQDVHYISFSIRKKDDTSITISDFKNTKFTLSEVDKTIVLRSLPNGACDTLNVETGEYVQRIGELVMSGSSSEKWQVWSGTQNTESVYTFQLNKCNNESSRTISVCDKYLTYPNASVLNTMLGEGVALNNGNGYLRILKTKAGSGSVDELKTYLASNPITVQYELTTPIIKTVDLSGYPFSYENGHVILSSGSIEQSLTPKVDYSVATNRNGQIRSNQKMVERHQKQLDQLQAIILANLVNSQYNQTLTTLKYELSRV